MMRKVLGTCAVLGVVLLATASCSKEEAAQTPPDKTPETKAPDTAKQPDTKPDPAKKAPDAKDLAATMKNDAKNCPSAAPDSRTTISTKDGKLVVMIEGKTAGAINMVRDRAKLHMNAPTDAPGKVEHTGKGTGGRNLGLCPILMPDTTQALEAIDNGVKVTLTPSDPAKLGQIKEDADKRLADLMQLFRKKKAADSLGHGSGGGQGGGGGHGGGGSEGTGQQHKDTADGAGAAAPAAAPDKAKAAAKKKDKKARKKKRRKKKKDDDNGGW